MTRENLPRLTEAQIRKLGSQQSFERGKSYYGEGAIFEPIRQGFELRAQCEGSEDEPYAVSATLAHQALRTRYPTLRALHDELRKAQL